MANVTVIPATRNIHTGIRKDAVTKRKTAGYARVSTDSEEQLTSYEAQVDYYTHYNGSLLLSHCSNKSQSNFCPVPPFPQSYSR